MPLSKSQKGALFEWGLSSLALFLSGGDLHLATPKPDDQDVDRLVTRLGGRSAAFLQLKTRTAPLRGGALDLHFAPIANPGSREGLHLLGGELLPRSPWVGPRFVLLPVSALPPPGPSGQVSVHVPLKIGAPSKYARFVHEAPELATVLSALLDGGPAYPYPPPGGPRQLTDRLSPPARGLLIETETAAAITFGSEGRLHLWSPLVDDFGEDFAVTDEERAAALRVQPKGAFALDRKGNFQVLVEKRTFRPRDIDYLVFGHYRPEVPGMADWAFVIRADQFVRDARSEGDAFMFRARPDPSSNDKWRPWLYRVEEIAGVLETALAVRRVQGAGAQLPAKREEVKRARQEIRRAARRT